MIELLPVPEHTPPFECSWKNCANEIDAIYQSSAKSSKLLAYLKGGWHILEVIFKVDCLFTPNKEEIQRTLHVKKTGIKTTYWCVHGSNNDLQRKINLTEKHVMSLISRPTLIGIDNQLTYFSGLL